MTAERRDVRVGDAERTAVADRLSAHAAAGRLTVEELEERLDLANAAVFAGDLAPLEADLPAPAARRPTGRRRPAWPASAFAIVALLVLALAATAAAGHPVIAPFLLAVLVWRAAHPRAHRRPLPERSIG